ncbi:hypothetical protein [Vibrio cyclitrophicus]|uniref:hypothetical protein n=6 Tax=Vibrio TaxID=662 RepID=UPI0039996B05
MKNKIGVRTEYFTKSQAKGIRAHVKRELQNDVNVVDERLTKHNFGIKSEAMDRNYELALKLMPQSVKNSLIDSVLVLPLDQFKEVQKEHPKEWKNKLHESIISMMKEMEAELGFMPIGYKMHLDEGTPDPETGEVKLNPHAHLQFANVCTKDITLTKTKKVTLKDENGKALKDPKKPNKYLYELDEDGKPKTEVIDIPLKGRAPLSLHQTRGKDSAWAKQQDIAAKHLQHLGFERGVSKELTKAVHLSKTQHVKRELRNSEQKIESQEIIIKEQERRIRDLKLSMMFEKEKVDSFLHEREEFFAALIEGRSNDFGSLLTAAVKKYEDVPDELKAQTLGNTMDRADELEGAIAFESTPELDLLIKKMEASYNKTDSPQPIKRNTFKP